MLNFDPNYLRTGRTEWAEIFFGHLWQQDRSQNFLFVQKVAGRARAEGQNSNILTQYLSCLTWDRAEILKIVDLSSNQNQKPFDKSF